MEADRLVLALEQNLRRIKKDEMKEDKLSKWMSQNLLHSYMNTLRLESNTCLSEIESNA